MTDVEETLRNCRTEAKQRSSVGKRGTAGLCGDFGALDVPETIQFSVRLYCISNETESPFLIPVWLYTKLLSLEGT